MTRKASTVLNAAADHMEQVGLYKHAYFAGEPEQAPSTALLGDHRIFRDTWGDLLPQEVIRRSKKECVNTRCCGFGAIFFVAKNEEEADAAIRAANRAVRDSGSSVDTLDDYNDGKHRRKAEVVGMLRRAAKEVEERYLA
jgi:hypothetical protein